MCCQDSKTWVLNPIVLGGPSLAAFWPSATILASLVFRVNPQFRRLSASNVIRSGGAAPILAVRRLGVKLFAGPVSLELLAPASLLRAGLTTRTLNPCKPVLVVFPCCSCEGFVKESPGRGLRAPGSTPCKAENGLQAPSDSLR